MTEDALHVSAGMCGSANGALRHRPGPWPLSKEGNQYLCVLQDYFSKWIKVYAMPDKKALIVAKCLFKFMARYGRVDKLHSDLGMEFQANVSKHLYELCGVHKSILRRTRHGPMDR